MLLGYIVFLLVNWFKEKENHTLSNKYMVIIIYITIDLNFFNQPGL